MHTLTKNHWINQKNPCSQCCTGNYWLNEQGRQTCYSLVKSTLWILHRTKSMYHVMQYNTVIQHKCLFKSTITLPIHASNGFSSSVHRGNAKSSLNRYITGLINFFLSEYIFFQISLITLIQLCQLSTTKSFLFLQLAPYLFLSNATCSMIIAIRCSIKD